MVKLSTNTGFLIDAPFGVRILVDLQAGRDNEGLSPTVTVQLARSVLNSDKRGTKPSPYKVPILIFTYSEKLRCTYKSVEIQGNMFGYGGNFDGMPSNDAYCSANTKDSKEYMKCWTGDILNSQGVLDPGRERGGFALILKYILPVCRFKHMNMAAE